MYKKFFALFMLLSVAVNSFCKELTVESFTKLQNDISARTKSVTINGEKCALIKVMLPVAGYRFYGDVEKQSFNVNEYWVYVAPNIASIKVISPDSNILNITFNTISNIDKLESGTTYQLSFSGYEQETGKGFLTLDFLPQDLFNDDWDKEVLERNYDFLMELGVEMKNCGINFSQQNIIDFLQKKENNLNRQGIYISVYNDKTIDSNLSESIKKSRLRNLKKRINISNGTGKLELDPGEYCCNVEVEGYEPISEPIHIKSGEITKVKVNMKVERGYVDLGLPSGTLWATTNLGAKNPHDYGYYFGWGSIKTYYDGRYNYTTTKISGRKEADAATVLWGDEWELPSKEEAQELIDYCKWEEKTIDGYKGVKIIGANGNSIFIPFAGSKAEGAPNPLYEGQKPGNCFSIWLNEPYEYRKDYEAYCLTDRGKIFPSGKYEGFSIRPVFKPKPKEIISDFSTDKKNNKKSKKK